MEDLIDWVYGQVVGFLGNFFAEMGNMGVELFELDWVQSIVLFFSQLGWALFGISLVVCAFEFGIEYASGRGDLHHTALNALKGFLAVSLFSTVPVRLYSLSSRDLRHGADRIWGQHRHGGGTDHGGPGPGGESD